MVECLAYWRNSKGFHVAGAEGETAGDAGRVNDVCVGNEDAIGGF